MKPELSDTPAINSEKIKGCRSSGYWVEGGEALSMSRGNYKRLGVCEKPGTSSPVTAAAISEDCSHVSNRCTLYAVYGSTEFNILSANN